tara:strand:- start:36 stop:227 length:192 start_codon:yes stop_codon:yes gene_type:complete
VQVFKIGKNKMIDYNLILYIGIVLIISGFIIFIVNEIDKRKKDIKEFKQQQLSKSFNKNKLND